MSDLFMPPVIARLPVAGSDATFPVHAIYCVGRNYAAHAREMGADPDREPPFFFCKPADALVPLDDSTVTTLPYPSETAELHYEVELVVALHRGGSHLDLDAARACIWGYGVGLDMTRRDLQNQMKAAGRPWEIGKAFAQSAPMTPLHPASQMAVPDKAEIWLTCNGELKQSGNTADMIWSLAETISYLSRYFTLQAGDLIMTGTPEGVGAVKRGDLIEAGVEGVSQLCLRYV